METAGTLTKGRLTRVAARRAGCSYAVAQRVVDNVFLVLREALAHGFRVEVRGFAVMDSKDTKEKPSARNPRTGETICVPARRKLAVKPGKQLREALHEPIPKSVLIAEVEAKRHRPQDGGPAR